MTGPFVQTIQTSETPAQTTVEPKSARVWTTPSNESAHSNSKKSRISNVFGNNKKTNQEQ
jgi:hypothetical protein